MTDNLVGKTPVDSRLANTIFEEAVERYTQIVQDELNPSHRKYAAVLIDPFTSMASGARIPQLNPTPTVTFT